MKPALCLCPNCDALWSATVRIDPASDTLQWTGGAIHLRPSWTRILRALLEGPKTHAKLAAAVWEDRPDGGPSRDHDTLKTQICYLRKALQVADFPGHIRNRWSVGYSLVLDEKVAA